MELRLILTVCLFALANAGPLQQWEVQRCSRQCSNDQGNFKYEVGKTYIYNYESMTKTHLSEEQGPAIRLKGQAEISVIAPCEMALKLRDINVQGPNDAFDIKNGLEEQALVFSFEDGRIESVCPSAEDEDWAVNLKRGILSSLQVSLKNMEGASILREKDVLGDCETSYEVKSKSWKGIVIRKTKDMSTCGSRQDAVHSLFPKEFEMSEHGMQSFPALSNDYNCEIIVDKDIIASSQCFEKNSFLPIALSKVGSHVETEVKLRYVNKMNGLRFQPGQVMQRTHLLYARAPEDTKTNELKIMGILREICGKVSDDIRPEVPRSFNELAYSTRHLPYASIARIAQSLEQGEICASKKVQDIFNDALIMGGGEGAIKLITEKIAKRSISSTKAQYIYLLLSFVNRPTEAGVEHLTSVLANPEASRQALLGASGYIHNFCQQKKSNCDTNQAVQDAIKALAKHLGNKCKPTRQQDTEKIIVTLKSLKNIGASPKNVLNIIAECSTDASNKNAIRVAAAETLQEKPCDQNVQKKLMEQLKNEEEDAEIRIASYQTIIRCPNKEIVEQVLSLLKKDASKQVGAYITSSLKNAKSSSAPAKKALHKLLADVEIPRRFPSDPRKFSGNYELSHVLDNLNTGFVVEADVVYDKSFAPRSAKVNASLPMFGKDVNVFEIGMRQEGVEQVLEQLFARQGFFNTNDFPQMLKEIIEFFKAKTNEIIRERRAADLPFKQGRLALLHERVSNKPNDVDASLYLNHDGKTILYLDANDANQNDMKDLVDNFGRHIENLQKSLNGDRAFSFMLFDSSLTVPSASGMPLKVDVNVTAIAGLKVQNNHFHPSIAAEASLSYTFGFKNTQSGVKIVNTFHSAPSVQAEIQYKNNKPVKVLVALPKENTEIISFKSNVHKIDENNQMSQLKTQNIRNHQGCSSSLNTPFGIAVCSKMALPKPFLNLKHPSLIFNGPWEFDVTIQKTDRGMKGWEFALETPNQGAEEMKIYKIAFNTPNSRIDREFSAELQLSTPRDASKGAHLLLKTPVKSVKITAQSKNDQQETSAKIEMSVDGRNKYSVEAGLQNDVRGKKTEFKPRVRVQIPNHKPISMSGSVIITKGSKPQLSFDLHSDKDAGKNQFVRGNVVREGSLVTSDKFRLSIDVQATLASYNVRVFGASDKNTQSVSNDITVEYHMEKRAKQSAKLISKFQILSRGAVNKANSFVEVTFTQFPQFNYHVSWNILHKKWEHMENEMVVMWKNDMKDERNKIRLFQISKLNGVARPEKMLSMQNSLTAEINPLRVKWEATANGNLEKGETPKFKVEAAIKDKNNRKESRASFEFQHISRSPLKLSMDAVFQTPSIQVHYSDKLEEKAPNEFSGNTMCQWAPQKKITVEYTYRKKSDSSKNHHELDVEFKAPNFAPVHHQALLRMTRNEFEARSKLITQGRPMFETHTLLSRNGKSNLYLDTPQFSGRMESSPFDDVKVHSLQLTGKTYPLNHQSNLQISSDSVALNSKTLYNRQQIVALNAHASNKDASRFTIDAQPFDARLDFNHLQSPMTANLEIRSKKSSDNHKTTIVASSGKVDLKSKTHFRGQNAANVELTLAKRSKSFLNIDTPHWSALSEAVLHSATKTAKIEMKHKRSNLSHKSECVLEPSSLTIASRTNRGNEQLLAIDSALRRNSASQLNIKSGHFNGKLDVNPYASTKTFRMEIEDNLHPFSHSTEMKLHPRTWNLLSKTDKQGSITLIDGKLDNAQSHLKLVSNDIDGTLEIVPWKSGKFEFAGKSQRISHRSNLNSEGSALNLVSRTERSGRLIAAVDSKLNRNAHSFLKINSQPFESNLEVNPSGSVKTVLFEMKGKQNPIVHKTEINYSPRNFVTLKSNTQRSGQQWALIDSRLSQNEKSHMRIKTLPYEMHMEMHPFAATKTGKIEINGKQNKLSHISELSYEPQTSLNIISKTHQSGEQIASIRSKLSNADNSFLNVNLRPMDLSLDVNPFSSTKTGKLQIVGKKQQYNHVSEVSFVPRRHLSIESETTHNGQQLAKMSSKLSQVEKSFLKLNTQPWEAEIEAHPFASTKTGKINILGKRSQLNHNSEFAFTSGRDLHFQSATEQQGRKIAQINSKLTKRGNSFLNINTEPWDVSVEADPFASTKTSKLNIVGKQYQLNHKSEMAYVSGSHLSLSSDTRQRGQNIATLKSKLSRNDNSFINVNTQPWDVSIETNPFGSTKTAKIDLTGKQNRLSHQSEITFVSGRHLTLASNTKQREQRLAKINARLSKRENSFVQVNTQPWDVSVDANAFSHTKTGKISIVGKRNQLNHDSEISYVSGRHLSLSSDTRHRGEQIALINSKLAKGESSYIKVNTKPVDCSLEINPFASTKIGKLEIAGKQSQLNHKTEIQYLPQQHLKISSDTNRRGQKLAALESLLSQNEESYMNLNSQPLNLNFKIHPFAAVRTANLNIEGKQIQISHKTDLEYQPRQNLKVLSRTERNGKEVALINSQISRSGPSHLKIDSQILKAAIQAQPNGQEKRLDWSFAGKQYPLSHSSNIVLKGRHSLSLKSATEHRNEKFQIESLLSTQHNSHFNLEHPSFASKLNINPWSSTRSAKLEISGKRSPFYHLTEATLEAQQATLKSRTEHNRQNIAKVDSVLSGNDRSHINIESTILNSKFKAMPFGRSKSASFEIKGVRIPLEHSTNFAHQSGEWELNSKTNYGGAELMDLASSLSARRNNVNVKLNNPAFDSHVILEPSNMSLNYLAKRYNNRRILGAISASSQPKNSFRAELKWDADKNPEHRVLVTANAEKQGGWSDRKTISNIRIEYGQQYKATINTKTSNDLISGPHDIDITIKMPKANPAELTFHHELKNGQIQCQAKYIRNGAVKITLTNSGKFERNENGIKIQGNVEVASEYKEIDGMQLGINHQFTNGRNGIDMQSELKAQAETGKPFELKINANHKSSYSGIMTTARVSASTPIYDFRNQEASIVIRSENLKGSIELNANNSRGKKVKSNAQWDLNRNSASVSANLKSDFRQIPSVKAQANIENQSQKKAAGFAIDVNNQRKAEVNANMNFNGYDNYDATASANSPYTPRVELSVRGSKNSNKISYELVAKKDAQEMLVAKLNGKKDRDGFSGNAFITSFGSELARMDLEHKELSSGEMNYIASYKGPISPIKISFKQSKNSKEIRHNVALCFVKEDKCYSYEAYYKNDDSHYGGKFDRVLNVAVRNQANANQIRLDMLLNNKQDMNNKIVLDVNGKKIGYEIRVNEDRNRKNALAKVILPQRVMEARGKAENLGEEMRLTGEFLADAIREPADKIVLEVSHKNRRNQAINSEVKLSHKAWRRPILMSYSLDKKSQSSLLAKIVMDVSDDENKKLTIEASLANELNGNHSAAINVFNQNRRSLDIELKGHVALNQQAFSKGFQWKWLTRNGERKQGFYLLKVDRNSKQVMVIAQNPSSKLQAHGNYQVSDNQINVSGDVTINGKTRKAELIADANQKPCIEINLLKGAANPTHKWQACLDVQGDRLLQVTATSFNGAEKMTDASFVFDQRSGKDFKAHLHWKPESLGELIYAVANAAENSKLADFGLDEIKEEAEHRYRMLKKNVADSYNPFARSVIQELSQFSQEMADNSQPLIEAYKQARDYLPDSSKLEEIYETVKSMIADLLNKVLPDSLSEKIDSQIRKVTRAMTRACSYDSTCYNLAYAYERQGMAGVQRELIKAARKAHRVVLSTKGQLAERLLNRLPNFEQLKESAQEQISSALDQISNNKFAAKIRDVLESTVRAVQEHTEDAFEHAAEIGQQIANTLLQNEDIRSVARILKELLNEAKQELRNIEWEKIAQQSQELAKFLLTPKNLLLHSRLLVWNPQNGEILFEVRSPVNVNKLKAIYQPSEQNQYSNLSDKLNSLKSNLWSEWVPPFKAQAMIVGGQHFVTFDRHFYDFAGPKCSYLLARDFMDGNFSVMAKYNGLDNQGRVQKSLIVSVSDKHVELIPEINTVKLDGAIVDLPLFLGAATVMRRGESIVVDDKHGIMVECQLQHDICTVSVAGWYYGKTGGLFGTYDYEPNNDMRLPRGGVARHAVDLANAWEVEDSCRTQNLAREEEINKGTEAFEVCYNYFANEDSPLRAGFSVVNPQDFFKMCLRHMSASKRFAQPEKSICTISAAYIKLLKHHNFNLNMPSACLSCDNMPYGSRKVLSPSYAGKKSDVVIVVEEHECNRGLVKEIDGIARLIDRELKNAGFTNNKFGVVAFSGPEESGEPHAHTARGKLMFEVQDVVLATERMEYRRRANKQRDVDTFEAISFASEYPFRAGASKNMILMTCTPCQEQVMRLDYSDVQRLLLSEGITLHIVNDKPIEVKSASKSRGIFAVDALTVFRSKDVVSAKLDGQRDLRSQVVVPKDVCIALAQESRGSFFTSKPLFSGESKQWRSLLARRVVKTADPQLCQVCDCVLDRDLLHPRQVCRPCKPLSPANFSNMY